jgi:hypothetical protein
MKSIVKIACLFILTLCASGHVLMAQTATNAAPRLMKRFTGKIASLDAQAKTFTVDSATNDVTLVNAQTDEGPQAGHF